MRHPSRSKGNPPWEACSRDNPSAAATCYEVAEATMQHRLGEVSNLTRAFARSSVANWSSGQGGEDGDTSDDHWGRRL